MLSLTTDCVRSVHYLIVDDMYLLDEVSMGQKQSRIKPSKTWH